jgi:hypothetical protein
MSGILVYRGHWQCKRFCRGEYRQAGVQRRLRASRCSPEVVCRGDLLHCGPDRRHAGVDPAYPCPTSWGGSSASSVARPTRRRRGHAHPAIVDSRASAIDRLPSNPNPHQCEPAECERHEAARPAEPDSQAGCPDGYPDEQAHRDHSSHLKPVNNHKSPESQGRDAKSTRFATNIEAWQWSRMSSPHEGRTTATP